LRRRLLLALGCLGTVLAGNGWAQVPLGPEFQVNSYTTNTQNLPAIASDSTGNFVVVWYSLGQDGDQSGIYARKYLASGAPLGSSEFRVNAFTTSSQTSPYVASDAAGGMAVVWQSIGQDGDGVGIFARRYDSSGLPGSELQVNTYTTSGQLQSTVASDAAGNFVVAWSSYLEDGSLSGILGRRFNASGVAQGGEFVVNSYTTGVQIYPAAAADAAGDFVVAWQSYRDGDGTSGIFARRYNAAGVAQGGEFRVGSYVTGLQFQASVSMAPDGAFLVVWASYEEDGSGLGVYGQRYSAAGVAQGSEFRVNQYTTGDQFAPRVSMGSNGDFVVTWTGDVDGGGYSISARAFSATGAPKGSDFPVNVFTTGDQKYSAVTVQPDGRFVVAWMSTGQDGSGGGVFGRRFADDLIFRDDFESGTLSAWSSAATDGGDLAPSAIAAMKFTSIGLQGAVDDTASLYVQDDSPVDEDRYRARFYVDTNGFDPGETGGAHRTRIFIAFEEAPTRRLAAIVLKRLGSVYSVMGRARLDDDSQADTGFFDVSDGPHVVELDWKRSSSASANDGTFELWIDGVSRSQLTGLDNSRSAVDFARLGALSIKPTAAGTLFWDEFESRRLNFIGN
jgi:hypothetical protein